MVKVLTLSIGPSGVASTQQQCLSWLAYNRTSHPRFTFTCNVDVMVIPDQGSRPLTPVWHKYTSTSA